MLIRNYSLQKHKTINHDGLFSQHADTSSQQPDYTLTYQTIKYPTLPTNPLIHLTPSELQSLFQEQQSVVEKELNLSEKYGLIQKSQSKLTLQQYSKFYIHSVNDTHYLFKKSFLLQQSSHSYNVANTRINQPTSPLQSSQPSILSHQEEDPLDFVFIPQQSPLSDTQVMGISVQSIRNITGFSYYTVPSWSITNHQVFIEWQKQMIEDTSNVLVVNGSRQMGKSFGISELLIEESFIPGADILVSAFLQKTTNAILNYMRKFMRDFSEEDFTVYKKDGYIQNNHTGVCIHFRTLSDGGANVLGLTLRLIVVDEAQLITTEVFDDVLKPTMTTTGGRLIMIGTAIEDTSSYMYKTITEIAKGTKYNNPQQKTARLITVSADNNPLIHPLERKEIYDNKDSPAIQRQYFNVWGKLSDSLFQPQYIQPHDFFTTTLSASDLRSYLIYGIDPARRADRSGWSITYVENGVATTIKSGEVPQHLKLDWENQATFHIHQLEELKILYPNAQIKTVIDLTGLGDGVLIIFRQKGLHIDFKIQYTSGNGVSQPLPTTYHVPKYILLNNVLDLTEGKRLRIIQPLNKLLEEEFRYIRLKEMRSGQMGMDSAFFDDIANSLFIALFIAKEMRYLFRSIQDNPSVQNYNMMTSDRKFYDQYTKSRTPTTSNDHF